MTVDDQTNRSPNEIVDTATLVPWWNDLSTTQRASLQRQLAAVDFGQLQRLWQFVPDPVDESPAQLARRAVPPRRVIRAADSPPNQIDQRPAIDAGRQLLNSGRVGVILVAGGEGSRLGFPHPKGMYPIGPISGKSMFQYFAELMMARSQAANCEIPYYVMTSDTTHEETVAYFVEHSHFGLNPNRVHFFTQGTMPAVDRRSGALLFSEKDEIVRNPDGHGGILTALDRSGLLDEMHREGVEVLFYHQVDNPLVQVCDAAFLGHHLLANSDVSTKVVSKLNAAERMGVAVEIDGRTQIIEYSDLPEDVAAATDSNGELKFWAGSTAIHIFNRSFLQRLRDERIELPFHRAVKKVACLDPQGKYVEPATENAIKFERFIFDTLPLADRALIVETIREEEFCPLKNRSGEFSADYVKQGISRRNARWLASAGIEVPADAVVEISPQWAADLEQVVERIDRSRKYDFPLYLT
jgi:UDP-N-acetylglucosamine/UDP-N-acetylgalactosamine diphosphorylase